ncbi:hypothetical protein PRIPAC_78268 [Pristionchus pacificus]|uniref:Uncharacterized protein n=1 Tax=Pristionchus pacificus TaxID=54126 RepID=A0A2A6CNA7_PRIPA|nr:hypothetical protein PRIPAC_78268 [Pristionchus pacificus]|eukprot:PDM79588.1 hypothetical protein PRIPAC_32167 [Pristionchus pacificus]
MEQGSEESVRSFRNRIDNAAGFAYPQSKEERITPSMDAFIFGLRRAMYKCLCLSYVLAMYKWEDQRKYFAKRGSYHSLGTIASIPHLAKKNGVAIHSFSFSKAQNGKSSCDRVAAQVKRKLRDFVARENNIRNAKELFSAISQSGLKGLSVYRATVKREKT